MKGELELIMENNIEKITELTQDEIDELSKEIEEDSDMLIMIEDSKVFHTVQNKQDKIKGETREFEYVEECGEVTEEALESIRISRHKERKV